MNTLFDWKKGDLVTVTVENRAPEFKDRLFIFLGYSQAVPGVVILYCIKNNRNFPIFEKHLREPKQ